ncbi:MAG: M18 family aminopeptidase [Gammaproteobacteria bacterium]|nr:M18 family aminopeptidase [Gammaproteobacteria bacterium]MCF6231156.1 M18 family aminopeptidase [Gammaproteobacteria bacterium]
MDKDTFNKGLFSFVGGAPTPFHATLGMLDLLVDAGFLRLYEADAWQFGEPGRYVVVRNDSSLIAFIIGEEDLLKDGFRMLGAHTDSPCLKVKPQPDKVVKGYYQLGVEVYGSALLNPWFDRDLSLAGRVSYLSKAGSIEHAIIDFKQPIAVIPSLAIHLDRTANKERTINAQLHLPPLVAQMGSEESDPCFNDLLLAHLIEQKAYGDVEKVLDHELYFYDTQPPGFVGLEQQFIASARLDNLLSCYVGLQSLLGAGTRHSSMLICTDHEEVGSASCCGAQGPFLRSVLERVCGDNETLTRIMDRSVLISADNAHGIHPNYVDKHDENHGPLLNRGPVIKINANQRYATSSATSALIRLLAEQAGVPLQSFVTRTDMGCGSTIGPVISAEMGVKTLDIGVPTFAMHSIRELAGSDDGFMLKQLTDAFFQSDTRL